jgi:uncharacterized membrane protein YraQ (UPF0718 family)
MIVVNLVKKNKLLSLVLLTYIGLLIFKFDMGVEALSNSSYYFKEMLQIMPVVFILTVAIDGFIPKELITNNLGEGSGLKGNIFAFILGSVSAGPIYAAFPICKTLLKKGSNITNIVIILSAWAVIKVPMLANEAKFLGLQFMGIRWILTVISILIMGYMTSKLVKRSDMKVDEVTDDSSKKGFYVDERYCIGCGMCAKLAPIKFQMIDHKARTKDVPLPKDKLEKVEQIMAKCPAQAIKKGV